jgi:hypothetical protein
MVVLLNCPNSKCVVTRREDRMDSFSLVMVSVNGSLCAFTAPEEDDCTMPRRPTTSLSVSPFYLENRFCCCP